MAVAHSKALKAAGIAISLVLKVPAPLESIAIRSVSSFRKPTTPTASHSGSARTIFCVVLFSDESFERIQSTMLKVVIRLAFRASGTLAKSTPTSNSSTTSVPSPGDSSTHVSEHPIAIVVRASRPQDGDEGS